MTDLPARQRQLHVRPYRIVELYPFARLTRLELSINIELGIAAIRRSTLVEIVEVLRLAICEGGSGSRVRPSEGQPSCDGEGCHGAEGGKGKDGRMQSSDIAKSKIRITLGSEDLR